ncbi:hypothetical protein HanPSC8_Chr15g0670851 [Helianthus annuus]|nr:hypothetical protein HanPSC8_Chr15g0670851 [Helianthus annuus]
MAKIEKLDAESTVIYGPTVNYGGDELVTVLIVCCTVHLGRRKTIKLSEEPNTIMMHASALCYVVIFKQRIRSRYVE